jgi:hypothetical protein
MSEQGGLSADLRHWWHRLTDDQRTRLHTSAQEDLLDDAIYQLLVDTGCPYGSMVDKSTPGYSWSWLTSVREFILKQ